MAATQTTSPRASSGLYATKRDVVRGILRRELAGVPLRSTDVKRDDRGLFVAAILHFRSWQNTLQAAGIDGEKVTGRRKWTRQRVIREIRQLGDRGAPLNSKSVKRIDQPLTQAARKLWGSWDRALLTAGYDPEEFRCLRRPWTRKEVIEALRHHVAAGGRIIADDLRPRSLGAACRRLFGSFDRALQAAGIDEPPDKPEGWSAEAIVACIRARCAAGQRVNCMAVVKTDPRLYDAGRRYHGSWDAALRAAGLDPDQVRVARYPWTRGRIIEELRRRVAQGVPPRSVSAIRPIPLVHACRRIFGSCEAAAKAAGVDPAKIGYFHRPANGLRRCGKKYSKR
ncbi:MAG: hypothetical protein KGY81_07570 [Phycisphaerae bacterium]|nr:hypothetical protein [Phycisphaerae bacterium]